MSIYTLFIDINWKNKVYIYILEMLQEVLQK